MASCSVVGALGRSEPGNGRAPRSSRPSAAVAAYPISALPRASRPLLRGGTTEERSDGPDMTTKGPLRLQEIVAGLDPCKQASAGYGVEGCRWRPPRRKGSAPVTTSGHRTTPRDPLTEHTKAPATEAASPPLHLTDEFRGPRIISTARVTPQTMATMPRTIGIAGTCPPLPDTPRKIATAPTRSITAVAIFNLNID